MSIVKIKDKTFETSISAEEIAKRVKELAQQLSKDFEGKNPLFLAVLNGSFIFAADLMREITIGINEDLSGRTVVIVEDIVESGLTMKRMIETLGTRNPASVHICTLFVKREKLQVDLDIEYAAFSIPNAFIVGYGLDYDQQGRHLKEVYSLKM